jgi:hypothetical protein
VVGVFGCDSNPHFEYLFLNYTSELYFRNLSAIPYLKYQLLCVVILTRAGIISRAKNEDSLPVTQQHNIRRCLKVSVLDAD